ncbi:MAG: carbohydrate-binding domain-containing protein [Bacteroidaceae bacterium]|nr:carbohydrate-binding domain-containing protein [Bacteroidaceae bacterium]
MKLIRSYVLLGTFLTASVSVAQTDRPLVFNQTNGLTRMVSTNDVSEIIFNKDASVASFEIQELGTADYSVSALESLTFQDESNAMAFPSANDFSVGFDPSDMSAVRNLEEKVPTDELAADYNDFLENYETTKTVIITYNGNSATYTGVVSGIKITCDGAHVQVASAVGKVCYELRGATSNGSFKITSDKKFRLKLNGVSITNPTGAAINIQSGKAAYVMLASGTRNQLADGKEYSMVPGEDMKGTIFSEGQLLFSGSGSLSVRSLSAHGISSDDYIRFRSNCGDISIDAAKDGISPKDRFVMYGGNVTIKAGDDGIDVKQGYMSICGGKLDVTAVDNGLATLYSQNDTTYMEIKGGFVKVNTTGAKGHAICSTGKLTIDGGVIQSTVEGDASKAVNAYGKALIANSRITLMTGGSPVYDESETDYSSAAGIRSRSNLDITDSQIGVVSRGKGGKGINCDAAVTLQNSAVTVITEGDALESGSDKVKSRGVDAASLTVKEGTELNISSTHNAIRTTGTATIAGGETFAFSSAARSVNCTETKQTAGLLFKGN